MGFRGSVSPKTERNRECILMKVVPLERVCCFNQCIKWSGLSPTPPPTIFNSLGESVGPAWGARAFQKRSYILEWVLILFWGNRHSWGARETHSPLSGQWDLNEEQVLVTYQLQPKLQMGTSHRSYLIFFFEWVTWSPPWRRMCV